MSEYNLKQTNRPAGLLNAVEKLMYWAQMAIPAVYGEELIYADLQAKTISKLNEVVQQLNVNTEWTVYLLDNGVEQETVNYINELIQNGTIENFINNTVLKNLLDTINKKIDSVVSPSPAGVYTSISEIPSTADKARIYLISEGALSGHWVYWNGTTWTDGGIYQSMKVLPDSIDNTQIIKESLLPDRTGYIKNLVNLIDNNFNTETYMDVSGTWKAFNAMFYTSNPVYVEQGMTYTLKTNITEPIFGMGFNDNKMLLGAIDLRGENEYSVTIDENLFPSKQVPTYMYFTFTNTLNKNMDIYFSLFKTPYFQPKLNKVNNIYVEELENYVVSDNLIEGNMFNSTWFLDLENNWKTQAVGGIFRTTSPFYIEPSTKYTIKFKTAGNCYVHTFLNGVNAGIFAAATTVTEYSFVNKSGNMCILVVSGDVEGITFCRGNGNFTKKFTYKQYSNNLLSRHWSIYDYYFNADLTWKVNSTGRYFTTPLMDVVKGETYSITKVTSGNVYVYSFNNGVYAGFIGSYASSTTIVTTANQIRIVGDVVDTVKFFKGTEEANVTYASIDDLIDNLSDNNGNKLEGKSVIWNGDSICEGLGYSGGYPILIKNKYNMGTSNNYGISGTTITIPNGNTNSILYRTKQIVGSADYVILEGGINDCGSYVAPMGALTTGYAGVNLDETTFYGACESLCKTMLQRWPNSKLGIILIQRVNERALQEEYFNAFVKACEKWSIPYLDLRHKSSFNCNVKVIRDPYTNNSDGLHPNYDGYMKFYVDLVAEWMMSL